MVKSSLLRTRNFQCLFAGETISALGDQFTLIALPWLVLSMSSDSVTLGLVMALVAIPRAVFMLLGGAITDRYSPRAVMFVSNLARMLLVGGLGVVCLLDVTRIWMVYLFALCFGVADAFFIPAQNSIVPQLVPKEQLGHANTLLQAFMQISQFVGPFLVGVLISRLDTGKHLTGVGCAFVIDAATFLVSVLTLAGIHVTRGATGEQPEPVLSAIASGLRTMWNSTVVRCLIVAVAGINFFLVGPFLVAIPYIAHRELAGGASAYGAITAMFGIGTLFGFALSAILPKVSDRRLGSAVMACTFSMGLGLIGMGFAHTTPVFCLLTFFMSAVNGYLSLVTLTLFQSSLPEALLGRFMSVLMLASMGLLPVSEAISGFLLRMGAPRLLIGAGVCYLLIVAAIWSNSTIRAMGTLLREEFAGSKP